MIYRYGQASLSYEGWNELEKRVCKALDGSGGYKVWYAENEITGNGPRFSKDGITCKLYFHSVGYGGKSCDLSAHDYRGWEPIGRISSLTNLYKPSLAKKFIEHADSAIQEKLEKQLTSAGTQKLEKRNKTALTKWTKKNQYLIENDLIYGVYPERNSYGTDRLITRISLWVGDKHKPKAILRAIIESDTEFYKAGNHEIHVIGNGKQTTELLEKICVSQPNTVIGL